jgi:type II secretory pathway component GspD/PulD (secretin)
MKTTLASIGLATLCSLSVSAQQKTPSARPAASAEPRTAAVRLQFVNTDVSDVLQAISVKTHANIVYPALLKRPISLNITAGSIGEAIGYAASAASLTWKQLGQTFVVAPAADLKQMVESFGQSEVVERNEMPSADAITLLTGAFPYLTVRPAGQQLLLIGSPEDITQARALIARQDRPAPVQPIVTEIIGLQHIIVKDAATMVHTLYPNIKADAVGLIGKGDGSIGLSGPANEVGIARTMLQKLDDEARGGQQSTVHRIYTIRYSSARALHTFLEKAMPELLTVVGPEQYAPPQPAFNPLSGATSGSGGSSSTAGSSGSSGSSGGSAGGSSGGSSGGDSGGSAGGAGGSATKTDGIDRVRMLVVSGLEKDVEKAFRLLAEVDIAPQQVMIEVKVVDLSPERAQDLGLAWSWSALNFLEAPVGTLLQGAGNALTQSNLVSGSKLGAISRVPFTFQAVLSAMVTHKEAKILASPSIQVLDNDDANIFIGDTLRTQISQSGIAGTTVQVFEFPIGIILLVRPRVNPDGQITMRVHPVVSTVTGIGASNLPQTSTREAETTVRIKDGETMVIGGLIRDEMSKVVQEVPILSKLPLVGELFRNTSTNHRHSEIMVFITPHIVK